MRCASLCGHDARLGGMFEVCRSIDLCAFELVCGAGLKPSCTCKYAQSYRYLHRANQDIHMVAVWIAQHITAHLIKRMYVHSVTVKFSSHSCIGRRGTSLHK